MCTDTYVQTVQRVQMQYAPYQNLVLRASGPSGMHGVQSFTVQAEQKINLYAERGVWPSDNTEARIPQQSDT